MARDLRRDRFGKVSRFATLPSPTPTAMAAPVHNASQSGRTEITVTVYVSPSKAIGAWVTSLLLTYDATENSSLVHGFFTFKQYAFV